MRRRRLILPFLLALLAFASAFQAPGEGRTVSKEQQWVDSVYNAMSEQERLGQLFMLRAHSNLGQDHVDKIKRLISEYRVGGLCFFQGTPEKQIQLINEYQELAGPVPLLIAMDAEWGLGMRMKESTISFPKQLMLGAIQDNRLIYNMGREIARQLKAVGVHLNFAPVADVNNNPANPVIHTRSFGEDPVNVSVKSYMYAKGLQDYGVLACAKHFPGHGDTDVDSHYGLPVIRHDFGRLDSVELYPFRVLAQYGVGSVMVAHLNVPALDARENRPTTLSYNTVTKLLREGLGFEGLIVTDALDMKGVTSHFKGGEVEAEALLAGNDMLLLPEDLGAAFAEIKKYIEEGKLSWERIEQSVKKILANKYRLGVRTFKPLDANNIRQQLNTGQAIQLKRSLIANALTLVRNPEELIPFQALDTLKLASLSIGGGASNPFQERLLSYQDMPTFRESGDISPARGQELAKELEKFDAVIIGLHDLNSQAGSDFGVKRGTRDFLKLLSHRTRVILTVFGTPYSLQYFDDIDWVLEAYDEDPATQDLAAQALFGAIALKGRLPVTASSRSAYGVGVLTRKLQRFGYAPPESMGLDSGTLARIETIAENAIEARATPGCAVLVARNGNIIYEKTFGHHTYRAEQAVEPDDLYDLASLTKITSATLAVMKLYEEGRLSLDTPIVRYLPELEGTNKADMVLRDIMAHRAGLIGWIPFYKQTMTTRRRRARQRPEFYHRTPDANFSVAVAGHLFLRHDFVDSIWQQIFRSELRPDRGYEYSDLGFYMIARMVERLSGQPLDEYVATHFYGPMGLSHIGYNPWREFPKEKLVPTERDNYFRLETVQGYVHDMGAAMLGGVSGHAGLFANAHDVAVIMQMLLNKGEYGGRQFLKPETVATFTTRHPRETRRGIGFDMRQLDPSRWINLPAQASDDTFGHTGFTGTCAWADPEKQLVYVFLSNRTYPSMNNYKLNKMKTRRRILTTVYEAMENYPEYEAGLDGVQRW
ncbi:MAG: serine hydrolase [Lewinellaceae bacterium]|nr:serine hydrolase [Lewinellaceae bacterium]